MLIMKDTLEVIDLKMCQKIKRIYIRLLVKK